MSGKGIWSFLSRKIGSGASSSNVQFGDMGDAGKVIISTTSSMPEVQIGGMDDLESIMEGMGQQTEASGSAIYFGGYPGIDGSISGTLTANREGIFFYQQSSQAPMFKIDYGEVGNINSETRSTDAGAGAHLVVDCETAGRQCTIQFEAPQEVVGAITGNMMHGRLGDVVDKMRTSMKKCPYCAENIKAEAIKCRYCGSDLSGAPPQLPQA